MDDVQNGLAKTQQEIRQWTPVNAQYNIEGNVFLIYARLVVNVCARSNVC